MQSVQQLQSLKSEQIQLALDIYRLSTQLEEKRTRMRIVTAAIEGSDLGSKAERELLAADAESNKAAEGKTENES